MFCRTLCGPTKTYHIWCGGGWGYDYRIGTHWTTCHEYIKIRPQIAHSDMHHPVCGINSLIHSVSLASHVSTHLLIHLSAHLYYHHHSHHPLLLHSFTPGSKPTIATNPSHLRLLLPTGLPSWQRDWTGPIMLIVLFLVSHFIFLFVPCGGLSWLPVGCLLHVKYTLSYRIVSYVIWTEHQEWPGPRNRNDHTGPMFAFWS